MLRVLLPLKLTFSLAIVLCLNVSGKVYSQNITLSTKGKNFETIIKEIREQTKMSFLYDTEFLNKAKPISVEIKNLNVTNTLAVIFKNQPFDYEIDKNSIIIKNKTAPGQNINSQQQNIVGTVYDDEMKGLPGATIKVLNTTIVTISDTHGKFNLTNVNPDATLIVTYTGFVEQRINLDNKKTISIYLARQNQILEETVVVGYGSLRRSLVTNAIGTFKPKPEDIRQVSSPARLLEGRIAGVNINVASGNLGTADRISIRGISSISAGNEPLYVIDGVPINTSSPSLFSFGENYSPLAAFNHADIESIEILKDAASAAIYGSRASNGVVVITTRSGKEGRSDVRVNFSSGFSQFADRNKLKFSDSESYLLQYNEGIDNYNKQNNLKVGDATYKIRISNPFGDLPDTDWLGLITQTGYFKNVDANLSGGNKTTKYYIGLGYTDQDGIIKSNSLKKYNINTKVSHQFKKWLEFGMQNTANYVNNYQVPGANLGSTIIARAIEQRPFDRPYKPNGGYYVGGTDELTRHNPVQIINEQDTYLDTYRYLGTFYGLLNLGKDFTFKSSVSTDMGYTYDYKYYNANHPYGTGVGRLVEGNRFIQNILTENILTYNKKMKDISINAIAGHSFQKQNVKSSEIDGRGFPTPSLHVISVASEIYGASGNTSEYAMESYFGRSTFAYKDKYIFTGTLRADGSSKFHPNHRWGLFPSASIGWNASKEDFLSDKDIDLKIRASYGQTGNQEGIGNYAYQAQMLGGQNYGNVSGISISSFGNDQLAWEKADQYDMGFDLGLLNGKLNFIIDGYIKNTKNLLYSMPIHATTGMTTIISNIGSMQNKGIELAINSNFNINALNWKSQFNIAHNKNKLTSLVGHSSPVSAGENRALQVGKEIGAYYLFVADGLYQYDGEVPQALYNLGVRAGDVKWQDVDGNNIINDNDRQLVGSSNPDFSGGWNNSFSYKGFQLDILTTYMYGNDVYAQWKATGAGRIGYRFNNLVEYVENRWTGPGTTNVYPRPIDGETHNTKNSTRFLEDGSFIRLRALTLGYNFPTASIQKMGLKGLRIYAQGDNLLLFTRYSGWDPEVNNNLDARYTGVDLFSVPQPRTISLGVNINL